MMHADLSFDERLQAPVTFEAVSNLLDWWADHPPPFSPPLCLGWDIRRQLGDRDGFELWRELMVEYEPPLFERELLPGDQRETVTMDQFDAALVEMWAGYDHPEPQYGSLLIDEMSRARSEGWQIRDSSIRDTTDSVLDDLAKRSGAKRAINEAHAANESLEIDALFGTLVEAENKRLLDLFLAAQRMAQAHPQWLQDTRKSYPDAAVQIEQVINSSSVPASGIADALVQWVSAYLDRDDWNHEMTQFSIDVSLRARAFEARVRRELFRFAGFVMTKTGIPDPTNSDNVRVLFRMDQIQMRFNEWHCRQEIQAGGEDQPWRPLTDVILNRLLTFAGDTQYQFRPAEALFRRTIETMAHEAPYDPLLERLAALEAGWDGTPRLSNWLARTTGVVDDAYHAAVGRNVIGGLVRRAREPGCKHDEVMLLSSVAQGMGKSSLCRILALENEWFTDSVVFDGSPQNVIPQLHGKWCIELSELGNMGRKDAEHVKRFLSTQSDNFTAKYQALATDNARRCVFIGTTNSPNPLSDETGGRRWLPVIVPGEIDLEWLRENIEQIVGEAAVMHTRGESFAIPRDVWNAASKRQEAAREVSAVEELMLKWFDRPAAAGAGLWIASTDIGHALKLSGQSSNSKYGVHLKKLGYRDENIMVPEIGKKTRLWVRSDGSGIGGCVQLVPVQRQLNGPVEMQMRSQGVVTPWVSSPPTVPMPSR